MINMKYDIKLPKNLKVNDIVDLEYLARKGERDGLPIEILMKVDEDGFDLQVENLNNLHFDNSGRHFNDPKSSKKQIEKIINEIITNQPIKPVVIDLKGNILDGQHRACAFLALGIEKIPVFKSLMNDTIFDNLTTRRIKLDIAFEKDFFTKNDLDKLINCKENIKIKKPIKSTKIQKIKNLIK